LETKLFSKIVLGKRAFGLQLPFLGTIVRLDLELLSAFSTLYPAFMVALATKDERRMWG